MSYCIVCGKETNDEKHKFCYDCFVHNKGVALAWCSVCSEWVLDGKHICDDENEEILNEMKNRGVLSKCAACGDWYFSGTDCPCAFPKTLGNEKKYQKKRNGILLTSAEQLFFSKLLQIFDTQKYLINIQTSLRQLVGKINFWQWAPELNRDIDFCIMLKTTMELVVLIEYDDSSHERPNRKERDEKVDKIVAEAGYKILHIKRDDNMSIEQLKRILEDTTKLA